MNFRHISQEGREISSLLMSATVHSRSVRSRTATEFSACAMTAVKVFQLSVNHLEHLLAKSVEHIAFALFSECNDVLDVGLSDITASET